MDTADAAKIAGVGMYGVLMMARRGEMDMASVSEMFARLSGVNLAA